MGHSHDDRVAARPSYLCAAYGCPMLGTVSRGTKGGDFVCHVHDGADPAEVQAITVEINHNIWLAHAIRDIRSRAHNPNWRETFERIKHDLALANRADLQKGSVDEWMLLMEAELLAIVKEARKPAYQKPLDVAPA